jgi:hypothetical protein
MAALKEATAMTHPREVDYRIKRRGDVLEMIFIATDSHYEFRYSNGRLSRGQETHRGQAGDTDDYSPTEVGDMARDLALRHFTIRAK